MKLEIVFKDGRKETFDNVESFHETEEQTVNEERHTSDVAQTQDEGKLFEVKLFEIDRNKFKTPRNNREQERTRKIINAAFIEVDRNPEKYASPFYTLIPEKKWEGYKAVSELMMYANDLGGVMADWVQQALEWAQRISNGESWEAICNNADNANWFRMIVGRNCYAWLVGGSSNVKISNPASCVHSNNYYYNDRIYYTVPLVVIKKK